MTPIARTASADERLATMLWLHIHSRGETADRILTLQATNTDLQRELAELKATNAGLEKDAARYRWLRERHRNPYIQLNVPPYGTGIISGTECNEVIDAALATSAGERKGEVE